jgi:uncharacterized protein YwgA
MNNILRVGELICMIGKVEGRKRLQKTVYILQQMGILGRILQRWLLSLKSSS